VSKQELETIDVWQTQLMTLLNRAVGLLNEDQAELKSEVLEVCRSITHPAYRVAVFGPFNYGKSTLLNALLGEKTLPMDLVPTTGAAITVKYGTIHRTRIFCTDGSVQTEDGTAALQQYAVLDEQRQMHPDIAAIEVECPHPLLKLGLELIDLPGTDDAAAQNALVQKQLLSADLVIQLLDGRKLMTLAEREHLRDWLLDRGIESVIFVVNFLNLMEGGDLQQVSVRLRFLAESFRSNLPPGVSNLYQVDALPALRARLKGDMAAATQSGLSELESALQTIGQQMAEGRSAERTLPKLTAVSSRVVVALRAQIERLAATRDPADIRRVEIQAQAQALIQKGFDQSVANLQSWLAPSNLQAHYRLGLAQALANQTTQTWLLQNLKPAWYERQKPIVNWVQQAGDIFKQPCPAELWIAFGETAESAENFEKFVEKSVEESVVESVERSADRSVEDRSGVASTAVATGLGWILGGPLGAAVLAGTTQLLNNSGKSSGKAQPAQSVDSQQAAQQAAQQADTYLERFSAEGMVAIAAYKTAAIPIIQTKISASVTPSPAREAQLNLLKTTLDELNELTNSL
jgi:GTPase SAR1 family protein